MKKDIKKPKKGERYLNRLGEYSVIISVYRNIVKVRVCGENQRTEEWTIEQFYSPKYGAFRKLPYPKIDRTNVARHLLEYQLNMVGKTTKDTKKEPNWFKKWTISDREFEYFRKYAIPLLKKTFRFNTNKAKATFEWFNMQFGLKRKN